jgi:hypothetical protein
MHSRRQSGNYMQVKFQFRLASNETLDPVHADAPAFIINTNPYATWAQLLADFHQHMLYVLKPRETTHQFIVEERPEWNEMCRNGLVKSSEMLLCMLNIRNDDIVWVRRQLRFKPIQNTWDGLIDMSYASRVLSNATPLQPIFHFRLRPQSWLSPPLMLQALLGSSKHPYQADSMRTELDHTNQQEDQYLELTSKLYNVCVMVVELRHKLLMPRQTLLPLLNVADILKEINIVRYDQTSKFDPGYGVGSWQRYTAESPMRHKLNLIDEEVVMQLHSPLKQSTWYGLLFLHSNGEAIYSDYVIPFFTMCL